MSKPKVLHVRRDISNRPLKRWLWGELRRLFFFYDQEGYFDASLHEAFERITAMTAESALIKKESIAQNFDIVVVNTKSVHDEEETKQQKLHELGNLTTTSVLVETSANAYQMPSDYACNAYDIIFRREHLQDTSQYDLSEENQRKLCITMLPCLQIPLPKNRFSKILEPLFIPQATKLDNPEKKHDVFFCGNVAESKSDRIQAVKALVEADDIDFYGGLQPKYQSVDIPEKLQADRMSPDVYANALQRSRVVLALDGIGQFTFRHLETWYFGGFLLSSPSIRDVSIPMPAKEGEHFVAFDNTDDLVKKVRHFVDQQQKREDIAATGKQMFKNNYDPQKHGEYISSQIERIYE